MFDELNMSFNNNEIIKINKIYNSIKQNEFIVKNFNVENLPGGEGEFKIFNKKISYEISFSRFRNLLGLMGSNYMFTISSSIFEERFPYNILYFLEDDFDSRQWKGGLIGDGDKRQMRLALDHFPPNITNNIISLIKMTHKSKKLILKDFKEIWEKTNFANPDHHYDPNYTIIK